MENNDSYNVIRDKINLMNKEWPKTLKNSLKELLLAGYKFTLSFKKDSSEIINSQKITTQQRKIGR